MLHEGGMLASLAVGATAPVTEINPLINYPERGMRGGASGGRDRHSYGQGNQLWNGKAGGLNLERKQCETKYSHSYTAPSNIAMLSYARMDCFAICAYKTKVHPTMSA
jgi:hypothetical protein